MPKNKKKGGKGRGRQMVYDAEGLAQRNAQMDAKAAQRKARRKEKGCDDSDFSGSDEEGSDVEFGMQEMSLQEAPRRERKKGGVAGLLGDDWAGGGNLNSQKKKNLKVSDLDGTQTQELSRREREELERQAAERNYNKRHAAGETDEAKKQMERLKIIRARREAQAKRAEQEKAMEEERKKKKKKEKEEAAEEEIVALSSREIKKMNPTQMKEHLKKRGLSTQGNKKTLQKRLLEACK